MLYMVRIQMMNDLAIVQFTRVCVFACVNARRNSRVCIVFYLTRINSTSVVIGSVIFRRSTCRKQILAFFANKYFFSIYFPSVSFWFLHVFKFEFSPINHDCIKMLFKFVLLSGLLAICSAQRVIYEYFFLFSFNISNRFSCHEYTSTSNSSIARGIDTSIWKTKNWFMFPKR